MCMAEDNSSLWLQLALALFRDNNFAESQEGWLIFFLMSSSLTGCTLSLKFLKFLFLLSQFLAYKQSLKSKSEESASAILTAQAMAAFSIGDKGACKKLLFQA